MDSIVPETLQSTEPAEPEIGKKRSRKRSIIIFAVVSVLNAGLLILLWTQLLTPAANLPTNNSAGSASDVGAVNSPLLGKQAPDFKLSALNQSKGDIRLSDFKGKPVIVNFWASWCEPCKREAPFLQKAWTQQLKAKGVVLLGVDGPENSKAALNFMQSQGMTYLNVQDTVDGSTAISFGTTKFPETYFIDRNGVVVGKWLGELNEQALQHEMAKLVP
ncbi:TlpA family protein disulfide reductase [Ktedonosporobacter rubrisoli]|uniref:TlpA family protein disulfide reductase n=1 Tax=Ktedonosporobacter rubrisoli TaxID=2509675 RepID=A0A4P6JZH4_KTERU|nr:TlpA disulfide reductase family protein [Ktedonosporobacter rubrisoli]QBD81217.1 TlpA family protein disulfide reductase [Ktedonosporobacter rubrisoli]